MREPYHRAVGVTTPEPDPPLPGRVCVVLPTYNEAGNISVLVPRVLAACGGLPGHRVVVLVVDDGSPDGTGIEVSKLSERFPEVFLLEGRKRGVGDAYRRGISHALQRFSPDFIVQMDADLQHDPDLLPALVSACGAGCDVAIGSRLVEGGGMPGVAASRRRMTRAANRLLALLTPFSAPQDLTSGYRCLRASLLTPNVLHPRLPRGHAFLWVLLREILQRKQPVVLEIPMRFSPRARGASKLGAAELLESIAYLGRAILHRRPAHRDASR